MAISGNSINEYYVFDYVNENTGESITMKLHKDPNLGFLVSMLDSDGKSSVTLPYSFFTDIVDFYNNKFNIKQEVIKQSMYEEQEPVRKVPIAQNKPIATRRILPEIDESQIPNDPIPSEPAPQPVIRSPKIDPLKAAKQEAAKKYAFESDPKQDKLARMIQSDGDASIDDDNEDNYNDEGDGDLEISDDIMQDAESTIKKSKKVIKKPGAGAFSVKRKGS